MRSYWPIVWMLIRWALCIFIVSLAYNGMSKYEAPWWWLSLVVALMLFNLDLGTGGDLEDWRKARRIESRESFGRLFKVKVAFRSIVGVAGVIASVGAILHGIVLAGFLTLAFAILYLNAGLKADIGSFLRYRRRVHSEEA